MPINSIMLFKTVEGSVVNFQQIGPTASKKNEATVQFFEKERKPLHVFSNSFQTFNFATIISRHHHSLAYSHITLHLAL